MTKKCLGDVFLGCPKFVLDDGYYKSTEMIMHRTPPINVGIITAAAVHFQLPVSFRIVRQVVEHGQ